MNVQSLFSFANSQFYANRGILYSVITTPEDVRIFHSEPEKHCKPQDGNFGWFAGQLLGHCLGLLEGDEWKRQRQIFEPPLRHSAAIARIHITEASAKSFVESLSYSAPVKEAVDEKFETEEFQQRTFTLHAISAFMKLPFYTTADLLYGELSKDEEKELWDLAEMHMAVLPYAVIGGPYRLKAGRWFDPGAYRKLKEYQDGWRDCNKRMVKKRRAQGINVAVVSYWDEYEAGKVTLTEVSEP